MRTKPERSKKSTIETSRALRNPIIMSRILSWLVFDVIFRVGLGYEEFQWAVKLGKVVTFLRYLIVFYFGWLDFSFGVEVD